MFPMLRSEETPSGSSSCRKSSSLGMQSLGSSPVTPQLALLSFLLDSNDMFDASSDHPLFRSSALSSSKPASARLSTATLPSSSVRASSTTPSNGTSPVSPVSPMLRCSSPALSSPSMPSLSASTSLTVTKTTKKKEKPPPKMIPETIRSSQSSLHPFSSSLPTSTFPSVPYAPSPYLSVLSLFASARTLQTIVPYENYAIRMPQAGETSTWMAHMDETDILDMEGVTFTQAMLAGATAGVVEHVCMFPVDTIKTRMQVGGLTSSTNVAASTTSTAATHPAYASVYSALKTVAQTEGVTRLYRGLGAILLAAVPSHGLYFAVYEAARTKLAIQRGSYMPVESGIAGAMATMAHDFVVTPMDVVKQRLQVYNSQFTGVTDCVRSVLAKEGLRAFYSSYPTTVLLNIPYMTVQFATYESLQTLLMTTEEEHNTWKDIVSGAGAGALGGLLSTPLDVVKTRLQTDGTTIDSKRLGTMDMIKHVHQEGGIKAFTRGWQARMMLFTPSAAICWTTYEFMKRHLLKTD